MITHRPITALAKGTPSLAPQVASFAATVTLALACAATVVRADDWPCFRGMDRSGVSREKGLLKTWPKAGPKLLWTYTNAGLGYAGFAVVANVAYTQGQRGQEDFVLALDTTTGKEKWATAVGPSAATGEGENYNENWGGGPRGTPAVANSKVYALGPRGLLVCLDAANGRLLWKCHLVRDLGGRPPEWGYSESPLLDGDKVIVNPGGPAGAVAALDAADGQVIWRSNGYTDGAGYGGLVPATIAGVAQYVIMTGESAAGIAAGDGQLVWRRARSRNVAAIPTPLVHGDTVYTTSGYGEGSDLYRLLRGSVGGTLAATDVWANKIMVNHHGGVILLGQAVYGYSEGKGWTCQSLENGQALWTNKTALGKGSCTAADGRLYLYDEKTGQVVLIEASPKSWNELGRFTLPVKSTKRHRQGLFWTHPVISNGRLLIRDQDIVLCYDVKAP